jgi:hypothetical protein
MRVIFGPQTRWAIALASVCQRLCMTAIDSVTIGCKKGDYLPIAGTGSVSIERGSYQEQGAWRIGCDPASPRPVFFAEL